ncbi:MAG: zinc-dependent peptidase [Burkholderiaceae bacterium]|nr:zinc-dependent peptidase [Burkholderiaceae bacterium]
MRLGARWRAWRESRLLQRRAIPDPLWRLTLARYPFLHLDRPDDQAQLRRLATLFLAEKEFHGIAGFEVSDEVAVAVAAQACLPVLHLGLERYGGFVGIVMHADQVLAKREVMDEDGLVHEYEEELSGEAMEGGPLMLSWADVEQAGLDGGPAYNVVMHEFAHVLDMADGLANGVPPQASAGEREAWIATMEAEFQRFCDLIDAGHETAIDPYGSEGLEEFFAVAVESFFVTPLALLADHPGLYALLAGYFRQDPAARQRT